MQRRRAKQDERDWRAIIIERAAEAHQVITLTRKLAPAPGTPGTPGSHGTWRVVGCDGRTLGPWTGELERADAVINLAGRSVNCRYGPENRRLIMDSRIESTRIL